LNLRANHNSSSKLKISRFSCEKEYKKRWAHPNTLAAAANKKGKTLEELYGEQKSKEIKEANKKQFERRAISGIYPHSGKIHTKLARDKMSKARESYLKNHPEASKQHGETMKKLWASYSLDEKIERIKKFKYNRKSKVGDYLGVRFESLYELAFLLKSEAEGLLITRSNNWIPYIKLDGSTGLYNPDFSYKESNNHRIIVEIKPSIFLNSATEYGKVVSLKTKAALEYFDRASYIIITEKELGRSWLRAAKEWYNVNYKEEINSKTNQSPGIYEDEKG